MTKEKEKENGRKEEGRDRKRERGNDVEEERIRREGKIKWRNEKGTVE